MTQTGPFGFVKPIHYCPNVLIRLATHITDTTGRDFLKVAHQYSFNNNVNIATALIHQSK